MNEDYLWNKSGENAEIEKLENALKTFRYRETAPPVMPVKTAEVEKKSWFKLFPFAVPVMSGLTAAVLALGLWFNAFVDKPVELAAELSAPQNIFLSPNEPPPSQPGLNSSGHDQEQPKVRVIKPSSEVKVYKTRRKAPLREVRPQLITASNKNPLTTDGLTKEEKYAYDQLMTALAVTNSNLRLVRDKIRGIDEQTADTANKH